MSLFNYLVKLIGVWMFAGGHVGEEVDFGITTHDGETRESLVKLVRFGVGGHREVVAAGEDDVASRMLDAGNHGIGSAVLDHFAGSFKIRRRKRDSIRLRVEGMNGLLDDRVVEFREGDFYHGYHYNIYRG